MKYTKEAWRKEYMEVKNDEVERMVEATLQAQLLKGQIQLADIERQGEIAWENMERQKEIEDWYSVKTCLGVYGQLVGFDVSDYRKARRFFKDEHNHQFFLSMPKEQRGAWLRSEFDEMM